MFDDPHIYFKDAFVLLTHTDFYGNKTIQHEVDLIIVENPLGIFAAFCTDQYI